MRRNDMVSGVLWVIGFLIIVGSVLLGLYFVTVGGGFLYFIGTLFIGVCLGMLFLGMAIIITKLDNLGEMMNPQADNLAEPVKTE